MRQKTRSTGWGTWGLHRFLSPRNLRVPKFLMLKNNSRNVNFRKRHITLNLIHRVMKSFNISPLARFSGSSASIRRPKVNVEFNPDKSALTCSAHYLAIAAYFSHFEPEPPHPCPMAATSILKMIRCFL